MATFESELALKFAPTYHWSEGEGNCLVQLDPGQQKPTFVLGHPPRKPYVYFSVWYLGTGRFGDAFETNYLTIWEWDSGLQLAGVNMFPHRWDIERTAVFVAGPRGSSNPEDYLGYQAYYAAHEGVEIPWPFPPFKTSLDGSSWVPRLLKDIGSDVSLEGRDVYWSKGKHASFPSVRKLRSSKARDSYDKPTPDKGVKAHDYVLVDVGTLDKPRADWITWGQNWSGKVPSVRSKLEGQLWNADGARELRIRKAPRKREIERAQLVLGVEPSGQLDVATLQRISDPVPSSFVWTTQGIPEAEVKSALTAHGIDLSGLE
jgi:hypothetical protein